jgi:adenine-specific DNA-methyltransferase
MEDIQQPLDAPQMPLTPDWNKERLETLKSMFPDLFTVEGKLNTDELKKLIDPQSINETERYEFRWFGKSQAKRNAFTPSNATLVFDKKRSVNPDQAENLIIEGENLEVLKLLSSAYREKVKCIYIDPPYNTGKDFVYSDNFTQDKRAYWEDAGVTEEGVKVDTNTETDGRYHSNWLNMMYSRLLVARQLLKEDGAIFISIDDNELHNLRKLCDEVFGEENFLDCIVWQKTFAPKNDSKYFSSEHEYLLVYVKNKEAFSINLLERGEKQNARYANPDNDPRGEWISTDLLRMEHRDNSVYEIISPTGKVWKPLAGSSWRHPEKEMLELIANGEVIFGVDGNSKPRRKRFLKDVKQGVVSQTIWKYEEVGHTQDAKQKLNKIFEGIPVFDTPKPISLIQRCIKLVSSEDDIILDFFSGSGAAGESVYSLNQEDNGNRKFILVQIPEATDERSEAYKVGYKKISDITIERNKRVVEKILEEKKTQQLEMFKGQNGNKGLGFKVFKLTKSKFPRVEWTPEPDKSDAENIEALRKYIVEKEAQLVTLFNRDELTTEILLKKGFNLNYTTTKQPKFEANEVYLATDGNKEALICLDAPLSDKTVDYLKTHTDKVFICLERALDTTKKWNLKHYLGDKLQAF